MDETGKILGDAFLEAVRQVVREQIKAASNGNGYRGNRLLDAKQAAARWRVPKSWILDMARRGELTCVRLGHYIRFKPEDLDQFIKERRK